MELIKNILVIVLALLGVVLMSYGAYLAWQPLGFIIGGLLIVSLAMLVDQPLRKGGENKQ
ncbi:hypothetical protein [Staphylococcus succinus]|uniref:hypothetical protein n=1 Tax=Staphylococcus succinus TaxID=61015 RepID=UPI00062B711D|nr:hypothetical protein [Staphylococcus succinus]MDH9162076.1 hypothetical protein [Staphylococcus succinus]PNZ17374.1 hypothetical protein CD109_10970 [Staphylococcus succinus subsp. succinus]RIN43278.1 hypothetical protein BU059_06280 [Staphylococcus succinus]